MSGSTSTTATYDFDAECQSEILSLIMFDGDAVKQTAGLVKPEYFTNPAEIVLARMSQDYYAKYKDVPSATAWKEMLKDGLRTKTIRDDVARDVIEKAQEAAKLTVRSRQWLLDNIADFAKQQAVMNAMMLSSKAWAKTSDPDRFKKIEAAMKDAFGVALAEKDEESYDYFARIEERTKYRQDVMSGAIPKTGITTGVKEIDQLLMHGGWGRGELSEVMGGAKSTKSFFVGGCAASAVLAGHNVLVITLENSIGVFSSRVDAQMSHLAIADQLTSPVTVEMGVKAARAKTKGRLEVRWAPTGTLTPAKVQRWIDEYKTKGIKFDLVVIDYIQLMAPNIRTKDPIENSKSIAIDLRGMAQTEDFALLTPIQANREGHKSATLKAEHVSEDFNLVRLADLVLAINRTDEEKADQKARITFSASRNQADGFTVFIKQDLAFGLAVKEVESVE